MEKEVLLKIIDQRMFFPLILIISVYFTASFVNMKLGFEILGVKIGFKRILFPVLIMAFYTLYGQNIIPLSFSGIVMMPLVALLFKLTSKKVLLIEGLWVGMLIFLSNCIGFIFIIAPSSLNKNINLFFTNTLYAGNVTGTLLETIFPALALLVLPKLKPHISLLPPLKDKIKGISTIVLITYVAMFSAFYSASYVLWTSLTHNPRHILWNLIYQLVTTIIIILGHWTITYSMKKRHESAQRMNEERITKLEQQNRELGKLNEQLKARNMEQKEVIEDIKDIKGSIDQLIAHNSNLINQLKTNTTHDEEVKIANTTDSFNPDKLSESEITLIRLIALNKSTTEIMAEMHLSDSSVRKYISELYGKLGLRNNRVNLALYAVKYNIISRDEIEL